MKETTKKVLAPKKIFYKRIWTNALFAMLIMSICLLIGVVGYKLTIPAFDWFDSLLNVSIILSGIRPMINANIMLTNQAKVFPSVYALFSGIALISTIGILFAPLGHQFFHQLYLEDQDQ